MRCWGILWVLLLIVGCVGEAEVEKINEKSLIENEIEDINEDSNNDNTELQVLLQEDKGFPTSPVAVALSISGSPVLNQIVEITADITFNITGVVGAPPILLTSQIRLPDSFELVKGELIKSFNLSNGETIKHKISVRVVNAGNWTITANAQSFEPYGEVGGIDGLYISVPENPIYLTEEQLK
jgi:hypothetical protein